MKRLLWLALCALWLFNFTACSSKGQEKTALFTYEMLIDSLESESLESASKHYSTLRAQHFHSPLLKEATLMMAFAHMEQEQYLLANFYLDSYLQRFVSEKNADFIHFLKFQSNYLSFKNPNRDQQLLLETIDKIQTDRQITSEGFVALKGSLKIILLAKAFLMNEKIAKLYAKLGKKKAQEIYLKRIAMPKEIDIKPHEWNFLEWLFE